MDLRRLVLNALVISPAFFVLLGFCAFANNLFASQPNSILGAVVLGSIAGGLSVSLFAERQKLSVTKKN